MHRKTPFEGWERGLAYTVLIGAAVFLTMSLFAAWSNTADDAYITLRYARHLADGQGVSWNPGSPAVEGYSNFLFVLLGALLMKVHAFAGSGGDPMIWLKGLGALAAFGTLGLTYLLARELVRASSESDNGGGVGEVGGIGKAGASGTAATAAGAAAVAVLVVHPGLAFWAASGMETTVNQFLILLGVWFVLRTTTRCSERFAPPLPLLIASLAFFGASITRPESPIVLAPLVAWVISRPGLKDLSARFRSAAWLVLPFLSLYLPYTAWRISYFGRWLPNSAACKAGYDVDAWFLGRQFLELAAPLLVVAVAGLVLGHVRLRRELLLLTAVPLVYFGVFYSVDPVMSHLDRHFQATLPFVTISAVLGLYTVVMRFLPTRRKRIGGFIVLTVALLLGSIRVPVALASVRQAVRLAHPLEDVRRELGTFLRAELRPGDAFAIGDTGLVPFLADATVFDLYCLNCREATTPAIDRSPKRLADWILSQQPRFIALQVVAIEASGASGASAAATSAVSPAGVWAADRAVQQHASFRARYSRRRAFGDSDDPLHYVIYERRTGGSL